MTLALAIIASAMAGGTVGFIACALLGANGNTSP